MNILYIEDIGFLRRSLKALLENNGYTVYEAASSSAAYNIFKTKHIDLALVDINIPYEAGFDEHGNTVYKDYFKNGFELAKKMLEENPNLYVIVLSGNIKDDSMIISGIQFGIKDFITKPYDSERLLQGLKKAKSILTKLGNQV